MYKKRNLYMLLTLTFIIGFLMSVAFPLTSDDLGWGSIPVQTYLRWKNLTGTSGDGRFFGNALIILLPKMQFFLHLLYAGTLTILSYLSTKLTRSTWLSMIIMMGLLWLPKIIVAQTFGWNAGFINYVFALVFPLWLLTLADTEIIDKKSHQYTIPILIILGLWSLLASWINEPITLLNLLSISIFITIYKFRRQEVPRHWWVLFCSSSVGTIILLGKTWITQESISGHGLNISQISSNFRKVFALTFGEYLWLPLLITLTVFSLLVYQRSKLNPQQVYAIQFSALLLIFFIFVNFIWPKTTFFPLSQNIILISHISYFISIVIITTALLFQDLISWYLVLASLFLVLPFLIVHPFGPRAVFGSQLLLLIWWGRLWQAYLPKPKWLQAITVFLMVLTLFCMTTILLPIYEGKVASTRLIQYEATQNFQPRYYLEVPHHDWWWNPSISQNFDYAQQKFYHIYPYAAGTLVPYQTWKKMDVNCKNKLASR